MNDYNIIISNLIGMISDWRCKMTEKEMQRIAEIVAVKLKGDDNKMESLELKEMLKLMERKNYFLSNIQKKTLENFIEKSLNFKNGLDEGVRKSLSLINYNLKSRTFLYLRASTQQIQAYSKIDKLICRYNIIPTNI